MGRSGQMWGAGRRFGSPGGGGLDPDSLLSNTGNRAGPESSSSETEGHRTPQEHLSQDMGSLSGGLSGLSEDGFGDGVDALDHGLEDAGDKLGNPCPLHPTPLDSLLVKASLDSWQMRSSVVWSAPSASVGQDWGHSRRVLASNVHAA